MMGIEIEPVNKKDKKSKYSVYTLIALAISISVLLVFIFNINVAFMGNIPTFSTAVEAVVFLVAWLFYGMVIGYKKKRSFIKFISFYWGISGLSFVLVHIVSRIGLGMLQIIFIPVTILTLTPTYGLGYFIHVGGNQVVHLGRIGQINPHDFIFALLCIILSWSLTAIGYLLGYLLNKLSVSRLKNK